MGNLLESHTVPGIYDALKRAAATVGLNLTLEAHAYLNQEDDDYLMGDFLEEKIRAYGGIEQYMSTVGAGDFSDLEEKMSGALAVNYFYPMPAEKLKKCVAFLGCHSVAGRSLLERIIVRSAKEALAARISGMNVADRGLRTSLLIFTLGTYTTVILQRYISAAIFGVLSLLSGILLVAMKRMEKREYLRMIVKGSVPAMSADPTLRTSIAALLGRFYPGFEW